MFLAIALFSVIWNSTEVLLLSFEWTGWCDTDWFGHPFELWMCNFTIIYDQPSEIVNWSFSLRKFFRVPLMFSMPVMWLLFWRPQKLVSRDKIWINICKYFSGFIHGRFFLGRSPLSVGWLLWYKSQSVFYDMLCQVIPRKLRGSFSLPFLLLQFF